ncbi:MAG: tripartite tricarboxylate transporter substrate binding protein [Burkholderiales bacterium]
MKLRYLPLAAGLATIASGVAVDCAAQTATAFPSKPIRIIVPFAPAGPNDIIARIVGQKWNELWGHPTVIENRGGAGGTIGVEYASKASPDGYTVIMGGMSNLAVAVGIYPKLGYDPREFTPLTNVAIVPYVLAVNPHVPAKNVKELIVVAKTKKGLLSYGSSGTGAISHLAAELFKSMTGTDIVHVPYKGTAPAVTDVIAGQIDMMLADLAAVAPHAKVGKLRLLAVAGARRSPSAPELPTIAESGVKGYAVDAWFGLVAPAGVPKDIAAKLSAATVNALKSPDVKQRFSELGYEIIGDTPEQFGATIKGDIDKYVRLTSKIGIKVE